MDAIEPDRSLSVDWNLYVQRSKYKEQKLFLLHLFVINYKCRKINLWTLYVLENSLN